MCSDHYSHQLPITNVQIKLACEMFILGNQQLTYMGITASLSHFASLFYLEYNPIHTFQIVQSIVLSRAYFCIQYTAQDCTVNLSAVEIL